MLKKAIQHGNPIVLPEEYNTLSEMIDYIAKRYPTKGLTFIHGDGSEEFLSFADLIQSARRYVTSLQEAGIKRGDRAILIIENAKEFYTTFWACMFAGVIAAPISKPTSWEVNSTGLLKLTKVWEVLNRPVIIMEGENRDYFRNMKESSTFQELRYFSTESLQHDELGEIVQTEPDDVVFLQFSSGSTGIPKGVKLTNRNILINNLACQKALEVTENDVTFTWLPHTHDMGLFGQHLTPMISGSNIMVMSPFTFIRSPYLFLQKITEHKGTWFCSTNFGYDWMLQKIPDSKLQTLDLSSLRLTLNGAEPISTDVMNSFIEKFSACGYKKSMMFPAYGMAEATVGVALSKVGQGPKIDQINRTNMIADHKAIPAVRQESEDFIEFTFEGYPIGDISIRIADEDGNVVNERIIGEIQIKGRSVTSGYYNRDELTDELFDDGWLRTGDLGYMVDGALVVCGRMKDVIIIRGQNYFAHDLEEVLYAHGVSKRGNLTLVGVYNHDLQEEELLAFIRHKGKLDNFLLVRERVITTLRQQLGIETAHVIPVKSIPKTTSGKLQRFQLRQNYEQGQYVTILADIEHFLMEEQTNKKFIIAPRTDLERVLYRLWSELLSIASEELSIEDEFLVIGGNSIKAYQLLDKLEHALKMEIGTEVLVCCKTIKEMAAYIESLPDYQHIQEDRHKQSHQKKDHNTAVAITGIGLRLPGANTVEEFWELLQSKKHCITKVSEKRKMLAGEPLWDDWLGELTDIDQFDYAFFDLSAEEAMYMDPQQRLALEVAYEALEEAGMIQGLEEKRHIGVYGGISSSTYQHLLLREVEKGTITHLHPNAMVGNMHNMICASINHYFNFTGPALAIDTACSSYLVAIHHAVQAIRQSSINGAVVVGANLMATPMVHSLSKNAGIVSTTNFTKVFDEDADGSVPGEGVVALYLEPLDQAVKEKKSIYGVIRGTAINNDGYSFGIMAPNPKGQYHVLKEAYQDANISPFELGYFEAHGSGTAIGDPIEMNALQKLFSEYESNAEDQHEIGIGSVKTNIGHLLPAASGAGLIKVLLSLKNKKLAPSLDVNELNPALEIEKSPFSIVQEVQDWEVKEGQTRKAGISSFGLGGTNAHVVVEEWRQEEAAIQKERPHLLTFSAKTEQSLETMIVEFEEWLKQHPDVNKGDLCFTRNRYRTHYRYRAACYIPAGQELEASLRLMKGSYMKKRKAKVVLEIGDVTKGIENIDLGYIITKLPSFVRMTLEQLKSSVCESTYLQESMVDDSLLLSLSYWISIMKRIKQYGMSSLTIHGIGKGSSLAEFINEKLDSISFLEIFITGKEEQLKHNESTDGDIVLQIGEMINQHSDTSMIKEDKIDQPFEDKLYSLLGKLYCMGMDIDWDQMYPYGSGKILSLPNYPFEQRTIWLHNSKGEINYDERRNRPVY